MRLQSSAGRCPGPVAGVWPGIVLCVLFALCGASTAHAYTFGEPHVRATGPEVTVFDWTTQRCNNDDIPDQPSRAFRDAVSGKVVLINTHHTVRRKMGDTLTTVAPTCQGVMFSGAKDDPALYDDREWLASTYTTDGVEIHGLIHSEFQGWIHPNGYCLNPDELWIDKQKCWYNALTLGKSTNGGASFTHATPPGHYVAGSPYRYSPGIGPVGFFQPSNIVEGKDGFYYVLVHVEGYGAQTTGSCLMRTSDLDDPGSWAAWDGDGFDVRFRDPYLFEYPPEEGVCAPVSRARIGTLSESLTWSTYLNKWVLVGSSNNADGASGPGFYWFTSDDLVNWSPAKLLMQGPLPWAYQCGTAEVLRDPSLLDPASTSRNFETIGRRPYLFFTRFHLAGCSWSLDRDLIRIPIEFTNAPPPPDPGSGGSGSGGGGTTPGSGSGGGTPAGGGQTGGSAAPEAAAPAVTVQTDAAPVGRVRLVGKPQPRGKTRVVLRVYAPAAGRLTVRPLGRRAALRRASRTASRAGTIRVTVRLSQSGKALLRTKRRARARAELVFRPVGGASQRSTRTLTLRRAPTR